MGPNASQLRQIIMKYRLDNRSRQIEALLKKLERGRINESAAAIYLRKIETLVERQKIVFNPLPRAPRIEELAPYDIELGELIENPDVRVGLRTDHPRHISISGQTGTGKSTLLRRIIYEFDRLTK